MTIAVESKPELEQLKWLMEDAEKKITTAISEAAAKLDLNGLQLINVPVSLQLATALVKLDLSNNNLEGFPECVTGLVNLKSLDVGCNHLKSLPGSIGRLLNLKFFNVSSNMLVAFPDSIQNCSALEELRANFNHLEGLPDTLGFKLKNMRNLSVHSNNIAYLPPSISYMRSLRVLDVHLNKLRRLPDDIDHLINLEVLNASKNFHHLVDLPESIGGLTCLMELDVSYNQISFLPDSIGALEKLQVLGLEGNPLILPPPEIVEHSAEAVKRYLYKRLIKSGHIKRSSIGQRIGYWFRFLFLGERATSSTGKHYKCSSNINEGLSWDEYRLIPLERHSSPRWSMSPPASCCFSPRESQTQRNLSFS